MLSRSMVWFKTLRVQFPLPLVARQLLLEFSAGGPRAASQSDSGCRPPPRALPLLVRRDAPDPRVDHDPAWPLRLADDTRPRSWSE